MAQGTKMAKLRKFVAYRRLERPYTRISKFKKLSFVRTKPNLLIVRFDMGDASKTFGYQLDLVSKKDIQVRHNALESARQTANRLLEASLGKSYYFKIRTYPHHVLRENPLAAGAGADRMSTGMQHSFGKSIGVAARIREGQAMFTLYVNKQHLDIAKKALKRASYKMPGATTIKVAQLS